MAKITFTGLEHYMAQLEALEKNSEGISKQALYEGAKIAADEMRKSIDDIPVQEEWGTKADPAKGIREEQKKGLQEGFGISSMENDSGSIHVRLGFHGYNTFRTKKYPNGQPNAMIARSVESGTSFLRKTPFTAKAVRKSKIPAEAKMKEVFESEIEKAMKG
ncbi:MAG: HK97-gp10 family putative phage morphogenesis protein [Anaerotignum sp.]